MFVRRVAFKGAGVPESGKHARAMVDLGRQNAVRGSDLCRRMRRCPAVGRSLCTQHRELREHRLPLGAALQQALAQFEV